MFSCAPGEERQDLKLKLKMENVESIAIKCGSELYPVNLEESKYLVDKLNSAEERGMVKGIVNQIVEIYLKNKDTIKIRLLGNSFKWNKSGDYAFNHNIDSNFFIGKCVEINLRNRVETKNTLEIQEPLKTIERIFNRYNEFQESTDSQSNLDSLKQSFRIIQNKSLKKKDLTLLINVWMYYSVTDFRTREYTESVLLSHKEKSKEAIKERMSNKKEWETNDGAPFSELQYLLSKLEEK